MPTAEDQSTEGGKRGHDPYDSYRYRSLWTNSNKNTTMHSSDHTGYSSFLNSGGGGGGASSPGPDRTHIYRAAAGTAPLPAPSPSPFIYSDAARASMKRGGTSSFQRQDPATRMAYGDWRRPSAASTRTASPDYRRRLFTSRDPNIYTVDTDGGDTHAMPKTASRLYGASPTFSRYMDVEDHVNTLPRSTLSNRSRAGNDAGRPWTETNIRTNERYELGDGGDRRRGSGSGAGVSSGARGQSSLGIRYGPDNNCNRSTREQQQQQQQEKLCDVASDGDVGRPRIIPSGGGGGVCFSGARRECPEGMVRSHSRAHRSGEKAGEARRWTDDDEDSTLTYLDEESNSATRSTDMFEEEEDGDDEEEETPPVDDDCFESSCDSCEVDVDLDAEPVVPLDVLRNASSDRFQWSRDPFHVVVLALLRNRGMYLPRYRELIEYHMAELFLHYIAMCAEGSYFILYEMNKNPKERFFRIRMLPVDRIDTGSEQVPHLVCTMHQSGVAIVDAKPIDHLVGVTASPRAPAFRFFIESPNTIVGCREGRGHRSRLPVDGAFTLWFYNRQTGVTSSVNLLTCDAKVFDIWTETFRGLVSVNSSSVVHAPLTADGSSSKLAAMVREAEKQSEIDFAKFIKSR